MKRYEITWQVGYQSAPDGRPQEMMPASVPGAVQLDYARAKGWPPFWKGVNFKDYKWMEDVYWLYESRVQIPCEAGERAFLHFLGIDYRYRILVDGECLADDEGMFRPVHLDVTRFAGRTVCLQVLIFPAPKADDSDTRTQARKSCKSPACYSWDWHPRLVTAGLWDEAYLTIGPARQLTDVDASYTLTDDLGRCDLRVQAKAPEDGPVEAALSLEGKEVARAEGVLNGGEASLSLSIDKPKLWYPVGYGEQTRYLLTVRALGEDGSVIDERVRPIGLRRVRLVMNEGSWDEPKDFPKSRSDAPATLEVNGRRLFARGSNWVNAQVFPGTMSPEHYESLLMLVRDAHMNILRIWGGGFVNKESFFELCDEMGIMVWQEFPLACNEYPDEEHYLSVLKKEATSIVRRLRTHPCVILYCGGNELFNNWSLMTDQHHALRLLNAVCYEEDRCTPFIATSPLNGMGHGSYLNYDETIDEELLTRFVHSHNTAYTEFGCPSVSPASYLRTFMSPKDFNDCRPENEVWREHHAFNAWVKDSWARFCEAEYFFGGFEGTEDLCRKTAMIQSMCYQNEFEAMRQQWPHCAMAINWCLNEPWPTAAGNSLIAWPCVVKPAYYAVKAALRPRMASLGIEKQRWQPGERFHGRVWVFNDRPANLEALTVDAFYIAPGSSEERPLGSFPCQELAADSHAEVGGVSVDLPRQDGLFRILLRVRSHPEMDSEYMLFCRAAEARVQFVSGLNT